MIRIDHEKAMVVVEIHEKPTTMDIQEAIKAILDNPDHVDGMDEVWDFRHASLTDFTVDNLQSLAMFVSQHLDQLARRTALVVGRDLEHGIARMWIAYAEERAPQERRIFRDVEAALEWLAPLPRSVQPTASARMASNVNHPDNKVS